MATIKRSSDSDKRVVDKAKDDCQWLAKISVQEGPYGPNVEDQQEPIEQGASHMDLEAQATLYSTTSQDAMAEIKSTRIHGRGEAAVVVIVQDHDSLQAQPVEHTEAETLDFMDRYSSRAKGSPQVPLFDSREASYAWVVEQVKSRPKALEYFQQHKSHEEHEAATARFLERHKARVKAKAEWQSLESHETATAYSMDSDKVKPSVAREDSGKSIDDQPLPMVKAACPSSVMGLAPSGGGSSKPLATQPNPMTKTPSSQAAKAAYANKVDSSREPSKFPPDYFRVKVPVEVDDRHPYNSIFGRSNQKKQQPLFGKAKNLAKIVVGIIILIVFVSGILLSGGGNQCHSGAPLFNHSIVPTSDLQDATTTAAAPTAEFNGGNKTQGEDKVISKSLNATHASGPRVNIPIPSQISQALEVLSLPSPSIFASKTEDWIPTLSSSMAWTHERAAKDSVGKEVAIFQGVGSSSSTAPAAIWKLSFEYFELEETGDVHVGIVCDTGFTGADATSKLLYDGPAPLFFKSRTVALDEVTLDHGVDWYTGLPLITVGFGRSRWNRVTIVCGDMPSAPPAIKTDVSPNDSTSLALFQSPTDIATSAKGFPSVQAVPVHWVHLPGGDSCDGKALVVWRSGMTKQDSNSESKVLQLSDGEVKAPTGSQAFVVTFDVFLLQGRASLNIHLECVYKNTRPIGLESSADNPQVLFLSHTFSKHQVDVSVRRSGNQSRVTIGFWEDEFGITAICEDFDAIGSNSAEEARATAMMASQQQPEPPASKANSVCCGLKLLLFLALCGIALAVKQIPKRRIDQVPPRQAAPPHQVPSHPAAPSVQVPCQRAASSTQVACSGADPSYASSSKKAKPLGILKPRIREVNKDSIRFDKKVTVRDYHRTVGVAPTTSYALALDWTFVEGKATMESFGHGRTANGEACRVPTAYERRNILMEAGLDDDKLKRLEDRARALCNARANRHGT